MIEKNKMNNNFKTKINFFILARSFGLNDQIFFAQRFSLLLGSGISIVESLKMMSEMDTSKKRKNIYEKIIDDIQHGITLSKSIKNIGLRFNYILINLIKNGETSGRLSESLLLAFEHLDKKNQMKKKIVGSLIYPIFIVIATIGMALFLILYIFPKIIPLLKSMDIKLPLITRIVQSVYTISISYGFWIILTLILFMSLFIFLIKKSEKIKIKFNLINLRLPILGEYIRIQTSASFCSIGEILLNTGKSLPDVFYFLFESSNNLVYKNIFYLIHEESLKGVKFSTLLKKNNKYFPILLAQMCDLGERTGTLAQMLGHSARIFDQDIDNSLKKFSTLIEPMLMVLMGLIVGSIALSIILPVYEITNYLTK